MIYNGMVTSKKTVDGDRVLSEPTGKIILYKTVTKFLSPTTVEAYTCS